MNPRPALDVSQLPGTAFDARAPVWWANTLMLLIETTTVAMLLASYFYLWQNHAHWPPPRVDADPPILRPVPDLAAASLNALLLLGSCVPAVWMDRAARRRDGTAVRAGLLLLCVLAAASLVLRGLEFQALKVSWNDNAYASVVWAILVMHLVYLAVALGEVALLTLWVVLYGLDDHHALDVTLVTAYWYWVAGVWLPLYAVVFWAPRLL